MENLIKEVIELDKKARTEVELLEIEKSKISEFINQKKSEIEALYKADAKKIVEATKQKLLDDLKKKKQEANAEFDDKFHKLEETILKNKNGWIDSIYEYCVKE